MGQHLWAEGADLKWPTWAFPLNGHPVPGQHRLSFCCVRNPPTTFQIFLFHTKLKTADCLYSVSSKLIFTEVEIDTKEFWKLFHLTLLIWMENYNTLKREHRVQDNWLRSCHLFSSFHFHYDKIFCYFRQIFQLGKRVYVINSKSVEINSHFSHIK